MKKLLFSAIALSAIVMYGADKRTYERAATFASNTPADTGSCTVEVMVPGEARVRIHGDSATLIHESGRTPEWKKFECSSPMPKKPAAFRVENLGGRGKEELIHGPKGFGGTATVYIADPKHGDDTYSFQVVWGEKTGTASRSK
jgi:hypothetical protein